MDRPGDRRRRVLLVGVPPGVRRQIASSLQDSRNDLVEVPDSEACLERLADDEVDTVVVGDDLPGTDCIGLLERLRDNWPALPVVVAPGDGSEWLAARALDAGASAYLPDGGTDPDADVTPRDVLPEPGQPTFQDDRDRYRHFIEVAPIPINLFDEEGTIVWANQAVRDLLDLSPDDDLVGRSIFEYIETTSEATAREEMAAVLEADRVVGPTSFRVVSETGTEKHIQVKTTRTRFDGRTVAQAVIVDVTQLHSAVEAIRSQRDFISDVLDTINDVFYLVSPQGRLERWNEQFCEATGYTDREVAGMTAEDVVHPDHQDRVEAAIETAVDDGVSYVEADLVTKDGERRRYEFKGGRLDRADGSLRGVVGIGRDVTERARMEAAIRANEERYRTLVEMSPYPVLVHQDREIVYLNDAMVDLVGGSSTDDLLGVDFVEYLDEAERAEAVETAARTQRGDAAPTNNRRTIETRAAGTRTVETTSRAITYEEEPAVLTVVKDVTTHHEYQAKLTELHERTRELMAADTRDEIGRIATAAADELLSAETAVVYEFTDANRLELLASTHHVPDDDPPVAPVADGVLWDAFVAGERRSWTPDDPAAATGPTPCRSGTVLPLGNHGVLAICRQADDPDGVREDFDQVLARNLEAAFDRAERTAELRERDARLAAQNESLERVNRLNEIIRQTTQAIVRSTTRPQITANVCEQLADHEYYTFVWYTETAPGTSVAPRDWAGMEPEYVDHLAGTTGGPMSRLVESAASNRSVTVAPNLLTDPDWADHRRDALTHGFRSVAAVPVVRDDSVDGVFVVHGTTTDIFSAEERAVLAELGNTVAYALHAADRQASVDATERTALDLAVTDERFFAVRLAAATDSTVTYVGGVTEDADNVRLFLRFAGPPTDDALATVADWGVVSDVQRIAETAEDALVQFVLATPGFFASCREVDARIRRLSATGSAATIQVTVPTDVDVRGFVEALQGRHADTTLTARRDRPAVADTRETFTEQLRDALTERQLEALETATYAGFYEWPRATTTAALGDLLGIASSTFQYHLRAGERKLVEAVLEAPDARTAVGGGTARSADDAVSSGNAAESTGVDDTSTGDDADGSTDDPSST